MPLKTGKRRGIFLLTDSEKNNLQKDRLEKSLLKKKQKKEVFDLFLKEQKEREEKISDKIKDLNKKIEDERNRISNERNNN